MIVNESEAELALELGAARRHGHILVGPVIKTKEQVQPLYNLGYEYKTILLYECACGATVMYGKKADGDAIVLRSGEYSYRHPSIRQPCRSNGV